MEWLHPDLGAAARHARTDGINVGDLYAIMRPTDDGRGPYAGFLLFASESGIIRYGRNGLDKQDAA